MRSVSQRLDALHKAIRLEQLQQKFNHSRMLLRKVDSSQAIGIILNSQTQLNAALEAGDQHAIIFNLTQLHNVASQYEVIDFLLKDVMFSIDLEAVQSGHLPVQCTWVDLFLVLLGAENELIREEASALINISAYQLRLESQSKKEKSQYVAQIQRVLEDLPLKALKDDNIKVALNLTDALQQLFNSQISKLAIPYLLGIQPDFLSVMIDLYKTSQKLNIIEYSDNVVNLSLMLLFYFSQSDYSIQLPELKILQNLTKDYLISKIYYGDFSQRIYKKIKVLSLCKVCLQKSQIEHLLQTAFVHELENKNIDYLQMLASVSLANQEDFPQDALRYVSSQLFATIENDNEEELNYRRWLAVIVLINWQKVSEMLEDGIENMIVDWNRPGFTQNLAHLIESAHRKHEILFLRLLDICHRIYESLPKFRATLDQRLSFLSSYMEWHDLVERMAFVQEIISS